MIKNKKIITIMFFILALFSVSYSLSYVIKDPWDDRVWLNGWYTAAVCLQQNASFAPYLQNLTPYTPINPPDLPNGSIVKAVGDLNNYITYGEEGVHYDVPYVYSYSCNCDTDEEGHTHCSTCYSCRSREQFSSIDSLGFTKGAWDLEVYKKSLDGILFANWSSMELKGDNNNVKAILNTSYAAYQEAIALYNACKASDSYSPTNYIADTYGDYYIKRKISYESYLALVHPSQPSLPGWPCNVRRPNANGPACKNFPVKWIEAARGATTALTKSLEAAQKNTEIVRAKYQQMDNAGLCDDDYTYAPHSTCIKARNALAIIDSGEKEATYGQFALALEKKTELQKKVYCYPPQFDDYNAAMGYLWKPNGFNPRMVQLNDECGAAFTEANNIYIAQVNNATEYKKRSDEEKNALEAEHLDWIKEAPIQTSLGGITIGTIEERVKNWQTKKSSADDLLSSSTTTYSKKGKGYLKEATNTAKKAIKAYSELENSSKIKADAQKVVDEKKKTAEALIQQLEGFYQRTKSQVVYSYYQQAKQTLMAAQNAPTLGDKYKQYLNAIDYARAGLNYGVIDKNETDALLAQAQDLITRAERDEINTESERMLLENMRQNNAYDQPTLRGVIESIVVKAGIKYNDLIEQKKELLSMINSSQECGADLKGDLQNADKGLVTENGIDYLNGLGQLKKISEEYKLIKDELEKCRDKIVLSGLYIESQTSIGSINIDSPTDLSIFVIIMNLKNTNATEIDVPVALGLGMNVSILLTDITSGRENVINVRNAGNETIFTINEIKPFKTFSIKIAKKAVLAKTVSVESTAVGKEDRSADVKEKRIFDLYVKGKLNLPAGSTIDGRYAIYVDPGRHTAEVSYNLKNAYTKTVKTDTSSIGINVQTTKTIEIKPIIALSTLPISVSFDYNNVTNIQITGRNAKIENKKCERNTCTFDAVGLEANKTATIFVEYIIENARAQVANVVIERPSIDNCLGGTKKCDVLPSDFDQTLGAINAAAEANDTAREIELKEKAKEMIEEWKAEQQRIYDENNELKTKMNEERIEIEDALDALAKTGINNSSIGDLLKKRLDSITTALSDAEKATTIKEENTQLKKAGGDDAKKISEDLLARSKEEYNNLKTRLYKTGEKSTPAEFIAVEQKITELEINSNPKTAVELEAALKQANAYVEQAEKKTNEELRKMENEYRKTDQNLTSTLKQYQQEESNAKGTEWESFFTFDVEKIQKLKGEVESALDNGEYQLAKVKIEQLQKQKDLVEKTIKELKEEAEKALSAVTLNYLKKKDSMGADLQKTIEDALKAVQDLIGSGSYISALKSLKEILKQIQEYKPETINIMLVIAAVVLIAIAGGLYYIKKKGMGEGGDIKIDLPLFAQKKKEYRRLEKLNE